MEQGREGKRGLQAMVVAVVLVALGVISAGLLQTPTYEASAQVLVDQKQGYQQTYVTESGEEIQTLPPSGEGLGLRALTQTMVHAIDSRPVAQEVIAIGRPGLRMEPAELLDKLTVEQVENTSFIVLTYEDTDPERAKLIVNTVGEVFSEFISDSSTGGIQLTANVWEEAIVPDSPVSPHPWRNGLLTLVMGLMLCAGLALPRPLAARVARTRGGRVRVLQEVGGQAGLPGGRHGGPSEVEGLKEKELLRALGREPSGKLTAVEAALETSLSVEEANRMLFELAVGGHLEVTVEHGKLLYSFWGEHGVWGKGEAD